MRTDTDPVRRELVFGTVCGLGLSALVWSLVLWPPSDVPASLAVLALAIGLGSAGLRFPWMGRWSLAFPATLAILLLQGIGAAVLTAALTATLNALVPPPDGRVGPERLGHRIAARSIATLAGAGAVAALGLAGGTQLADPPLRNLIAALIAFALIHSALDLGLLAIETWSTGQPAPLTRLRGAALLRAVVALACGTGGAAVLALAYTAFTTRPLLLLLPAAVLVALSAGTKPAALADRAARGRGHESVTRALTRAIAAHDTDDEARFWRVRDLCVAVGARRGLRDAELQALATAALLHDIGKLAVPEPILTKPGRLSTAEMERVKIHPATGAEILSAIAFPPPICAIVRHHHERWDGRGYPDGLSGHEIPLGARILAAVDCYDAIISNRPYRRALPASEARRHLRHEAGAMFDPCIVETLLEHLDEQGSLQRFERRHGERKAAAGASLPRAQRNLEHLYAVSRATRYPIDLEETLTLVATLVARMIPAASFTLWRPLPGGDGLRVAFASGVGHERLRGFDVPLDERPVAQAVRHRRSFVGHDHLAPRTGATRGRARADLDGCLDNPDLARLSSSLVVPIVGDGRSLGAIALYDDDDRKFTCEERRLLNGVSGYVARALLRDTGNPQMSGSSMTDPLTGLPNARFLWVEAAQRAALNERVSGPLGAPYGLLALRVAHLSDVGSAYGSEVAELGLVRIAQRLASACEPLETMVRFGHDMFVVLSPRREDASLVDRWHHFLEAVEVRPLDLPSEPDVRLRLVAAHATYPLDGDDLDALFDVLESRLDHDVDERRTVVPFRRRTTTPDDAEASAGERPV